MSIPPGYGSFPTDGVGRPRHRLFFDVRHWSFVILSSLGTSSFVIHSQGAYWNFCDLRSVSRPENNMALQRIPEPEVMDDRLEVQAYSEADFADVNRRCARRALRVAGRGRGRAVDIGTGPAEIPIVFCRLAPGWRVVGLDLSSGMLAAARRNVRAAALEKRIRLLRGDAKTARGLGGRFHLVMSNSLLHHLAEPLPFWLQVKRLARPGGAILIQDLCRPASRSAARALERRHVGEASPLLRQLFYQSLLAAFTVAEVREQLRAAGLQGLAVRKINDRHLVVRGRLSGR